MFEVKSSNKSSNFKNNYNNLEVIYNKISYKISDVDHIHTMTQKANYTDKVYENTNEIVKFILNELKLDPSVLNEEDADKIIIREIKLAKLLNKD